MGLYITPANLGLENIGEIQQSWTSVMTADKDSIRLDAAFRMLITGSGSHAYRYYMHLSYYALCRVRVGLGNDAGLTFSLCH